jgi:hypothetical protein
MDPLEEITLSYTILADPGIQSQKFWYDDIEDEDAAFETWGLDLFEGFNIWDRVDYYANSGDYAWYVPNVEQDNDQLLFLNEPIDVVGDRPVLRFYHWYATANNHDAGLVQVRRENSQAWEDLGDKFIRNGYNGDLDYSAFTIPFLQGFFGSTNGHIASYIDLSDYAGERIFVRFRFGSDEQGISSVEPFGWVVDDVELMDLVQYEFEACVSYTEGDERCAEFGNGGLIINSGALINNTRNVIPQNAAVLFPNPAGDFVTLGLEASYAKDQYQVVLNDLNGKEVWRGIWNAGDEFMTIPLAGISSGFYTVRMFSKDQTISLKMIRQ